MSSTSNTKGPIIPRLGFIGDWNDKDLNNKFRKELLKCELEKYNMLLVQYYYVLNTHQVIYYKWLQLPFISYKTRGIKKRRKVNIKVKQQFIPKVNKLLKFNNFTILNQVVRNKGFFDRVNQIYSISQVYKIPASIKIGIERIIGKEEIQVNDWLNVYQLVRDQKLDIVNVINFSFFAHQLNVWKNFKYYLDAVVVCDFIHLNLMSVDALFNVIKFAFVRNSKRGQQRSFLNYIQKLLSLLPYYTQKTQRNINKYGRENTLNTGYIIAVNGKFSVTGRTQKFVIQPKKLPLHTLNSVYDYADGFVNTKAGTFSIRIWRVCL